MSSDVKQLIKDSKFRSVNKVHDYGKKHGKGHVSKEQIKETLDNTPHDFRDLGPSDPTKHYLRPIFTPYHGGWQIDLLQQPRLRPVGAPAFFFIAINVNTKVAWAKALGGKGEAEVLQALKEFVEANKPIVKIVADKESAWNGRSITTWLEGQGIDSKLIPNQQHTALGVIDRFIRTLRDMLDKDDGEKIFTAEKMQELIAHYNDTYHETIKKAPNEMTSKDEKKYIFKMLYDQEQRERISDYDLSVPFYARFIIPKSLMEKSRYRVSKGVVKVVGRDGKGYVCVAADGSTRVMQRWRLFPVGGSQGEYDLEKTLGTKQGIIDQIVKRAGGGKYVVRWTRPDGKVDEEVTTANNITSQSGGKEMLEEFEKGHKGETPGKKKEAERWGPGKKKGKK
jgi:uncharacterized protein (DUF2267 family)